MIRLTWKFSNDHQWHRDFDSFGQAHDAALNFGLFTHPNIVHVHIKDLEKVKEKPLNLPQKLSRLFLRI